MIDDGNAISLGGVDYTVHPVPGFLYTFDVFRGGDCLGAFLVHEDGKIDLVLVDPHTERATRDILLLVGQEHVGPNYCRTP